MLACAQLIADQIIIVNQEVLKVIGRLCDLFRLDEQTDSVEINIISRLKIEQELNNSS